MFKFFIKNNSSICLEFSFFILLTQMSKIYIGLLERKKMYMCVCNPLRMVFCHALYLITKFIIFPK